MMRPWASAPSAAGTATVSPGDEEAARHTATQPAEPVQDQSEDDIGWPKQ
ncbi:MULTISPECIES: hypothetical protein [Streptomyces]|nr:hypothetical protein [Streptomyces sp. NEAU-HV9]